MFIVTDCRDKDKKNCAGWAKRGFCEEYNFKKYMTKNCPLSCEICTVCLTSQKTTTLPAKTFRAPPKTTTLQPETIRSTSKTVTQKQEIIISAQLPTTPECSNTGNQNCL